MAQYLGLWLVSLTATLISGLDEHGSSVSVRLDDATVKPLESLGGYDKVEGFMHVGTNSRRTMFLDTAECQGACDSGNIRIRWILTTFGRSQVSVV
jgi:hypothetical protein